MKTTRLFDRHARTLRGLLAELKRLVDGLAQRLTPRPDGRRPILQGRVVIRVREFVERLEELTAQTMPLLTCIVAEMREVLSDWQPHELRNLGTVRHEVAEVLAQVSVKLSSLLGEAVHASESSDVR
jgi:hypothetical protein